MPWRWAMSVMTSSEGTPTFCSFSEDLWLSSGVSPRLGTKVRCEPGITISPPLYGKFGVSAIEQLTAADGMPAPRAGSCTIALTPNFPYNGGLMGVPGSHRTCEPSLGETPQDQHKSTLNEHKIGV